MRYVGRKKEYTPQKLGKAVRRYFDSISREITVTEMLPTDERDDKGHVIYEQVPVENSLGEPMKTIQFLIPPTVGGLCAYLGIHRDTWNSYCNSEEFSDTTTYARGRMHAYLEQEMLTRPGKDLKGILFNLENNYGYSEKMNITTDTMEEFLRRQQDETGGGQEF